MDTAKARIQWERRPNSAKMQKRFRKGDVRFGTDLDQLQHITSLIEMGTRNGEKSTSEGSGVAGGLSARRRSWICKRTGRAAQVNRISASDNPGIGGARIRGRFAG